MCLQACLCQISECHRPARNINHDIKAANTRVYATPLAQPYHTDSADAVGLLCLRPGLQGGLSSWASSISVHNELLRRGRRVRSIVRVRA